MRCEDLTRELESPTGALSRLEMAEHLAACPGCAERSRRASHFDRIWEATRPTEPSSDALDTLWARASLRLDALEAVPAAIPFERPKARRRLAMAAFVLAQAAAILTATVILLRRDEARPVEFVDVPKLVDQPAPLDLMVGFDQLAVVRIGKDNAPKVEIHDQSDLFNSSLLPAFTPHDEIGDMEAKASTLGVVAVQ